MSAERSLDPGQVTGARARIRWLEYQLALSENLTRIQAECIHDLVEGLDPISAAMEFLRRQGWRLPVEVRAAVHGALEEADAGVALARLMRDRLMDVCRANETRGNVHVQETVRQALGLLSRRIRAPIEVLEEVHPDMVVFVERGKLLIMVFNLLRNAARALDQRLAGAEPPRICICGREQAQQKRVTVRDNGPGLPGRARPLGVPLEEFQSEYARDLDICYRLMEQWGGSIEVRSEPGRFCEVDLIFPASADEPDIDAAQPPQETPGHD